MRTALDQESPRWRRCRVPMCRNEKTRCLTTETVEGTALALESVDNVEGGDSLALGVLSVGDGVTDNALEEGLEDTTGLFVDHG
jgi:hypothetical protein